MKRTTIATVLLLCFMVSFSFSGVVAVCTAEDATVSTYVSHYYTLYSLSSPATLRLPGLFCSAPPAVTRKLRISAASPAFSRASPSCASFTPR